MSPERLGLESSYVVRPGSAQRPSKTAAAEGARAPNPARRTQVEILALALQRLQLTGFSGPHRT